jgi:hypothetical protein
MVQAIILHVMTLVVGQMFVAMEQLIRHHVATSHHLHLHHVETEQATSQIVMILVVGLEYVVTERQILQHVTASLDQAHVEMVL